MFLIYPYWNVNEPVDKKIRQLERVSNLSILECKQKTYVVSDKSSDMFLIYPYWNVNIE